MSNCKIKNSVNKLSCDNINATLKFNNLERYMQYTKKQTKKF